MTIPNASSGLHKRHWHVHAIIFILSIRCLLIAGAAVKTDDDFERQLVHKHAQAIVFIVSIVS